MPVSLKLTGAARVARKNRDATAAAAEASGGRPDMAAVSWLVGWVGGWTLATLFLSRRAAVAAGCLAAGAACASVAG